MTLIAPAGVSLVTVVPILTVNQAGHNLLHEKKGRVGGPFREALFLRRTRKPNDIGPFLGCMSVSLVSRRPMAADRVCHTPWCATRVPHVCHTCAATGGPALASLDTRSPESWFLRPTPIRAELDGECL